MNWKFWKQDNPANTPADRLHVKLPGPKELPQQIGRYLVVEEKLDPDYVWNLRYVARPRTERKHYFDFRLFSSKAAQTAQVRVINYDSLDNHPELVLFKGRFCKDDAAPEMDRTPPIPRAA
jgi:hypothetical protein